MDVNNISRTVMPSSVFAAYKSEDKPEEAEHHG